MFLLRSTFLILLLSATAIGSATDRADSLRTVIATTSEGDVLRETKYLLAEYLVQRGPEEAEALAQDLEKELPMDGDSAEWSRWKYIIAASHRWQGNYKTALGHYDQLYRFFKAKEDKENIAKSGRFIGRLQMYLGNNVLAQRHLLEVAELYDEVGTDRQKASINNSLASFYSNIDQEEKALASYLKALSMFEALNDSAGMASSNGNLGTVYTDRGDFEKAEYHLMKSLSYCSVFPTNRELGFMRDFLGNLRQAQGRLDEAYEQHLIALRYREKLSSTYNLCESKLNTGEVLIKLGRYDEAIDHLEDVLGYEEHESLNQQDAANKLLALAYEKKGDYAKSLTYYKAFKSISDSIYTKESIQVIAEKDAKYQQKEKDAEIALLSKENELAEAEIGRSRLMLWGGGLALGVFTVLTALLFNLYRKVKARNETIRLALQEKNLLIHEIHHRVKNNLQIISSILSLQSRYINDPAALDAIKDGRNRVQSMAILHKNLYQEDDITGVNMQTYFSNLVNGIFSSYDLTKEEVQLELDIHDVSIDVDTVIPIGLITNELITNSLRHAFQDSVGESKIKVMLKETLDQYELIVSDNGRGIQDEVITNAKDETFGRKMISAFVSKLKATISIDNTEGTEVVIRIPKVAV